MNMANDQNAAVEAGADQTVKHSIWLLLGIVAFSLALFIVLGQLLARSIAKFVAKSENELDAIGKSQAVIEFKLDGTIITANENFLNALGYTLEEIRGQHHRMFCEPAFVASPEYQEFWATLNRGEYQAAEYKRLGKGGKEVGFRPLTTRSSTKTASRIRSSSTRLTSPKRSKFARRQSNFAWPSTTRKPRR